MSSISASNRRDKTTSNPKPTAASWGANSTPSFSFSSSSSAAAAPSSSTKKTAPRRNRKSPFTDFGTYMIEKKRKLTEQFEEKSVGGDNSGLFRGVSIFVDGLTVPPPQELRGYMLKHGGRFENYFSRKRVTHIVCTNLPQSKMSKFRSFSGGLPVVRPAWIVDSLKAKRLLSCFPYQLNELLSESFKQQKLSSFFHLKGGTSFKNVEEKCSSRLKNDDCAIESCENSERIKTNESEVALSADEEGLSKVEIAEIEIDEDPKEIADHCISAPQGHQRHQIHDNSSFIYSAEEEGLSKIETAEVDVDEDPKKIADRCISAPQGHQRHQTHHNSTFIENYFKNSRLHFIGTWRSRYRKRFADKIHKNKFEVNKDKALSNERAIIHIDMDCFFVSVVVRSIPELLDKPVAVCHSDSPKGTAEISSASYPARHFGIKAGMFVRDAKVLCPQLVILPYNFEAYEEVADKFYDILHKHCARVQAVSCDEAFLDVTDTSDDPVVVASTIRKEIMQTTGCTASAGIAQTLLLARLATRSAKPNGQLFLSSEKIDDYLKDLPVNVLPGIGWALEEKLKAHHISTCGQLQMFSKEALKKEFGKKIGDTLWNYSRGIDNRTVGIVQETKSVGAEVNWGVRFKNMTECENFLMNICKEVSLRLNGCSMRGHTITLKVKKRKAGAGEPIKYMGCGECINISRSMTVPMATDDFHIMNRICKQLFGSFHIDVIEVRGIGLHVSRLEHVDLNKQGPEGNRLESWLASGSYNTRSSHERDIYVERKDSGGEFSAKCINFGNQQLDDTCEKSSFYVRSPACSSSSNISGPGSLNCALHFPPISHLDMDIIRNLPPNILSEMNEVYNGRLYRFMENFSKRKKTQGMEVNKMLLPDFEEEHCERDVEINIKQTASQHSTEKGIDERVQSLSTPLVYSTLSEKKGKDVETTSLRSITCPDVCRPDLVPDSLSKVDLSNMQKLPEEMKSGEFPAHRRLNDAHVLQTEQLDDAYVKEIQDSGYHRLTLWEGDPPLWVHIFEVSSSPILNIFAESYLKCARSNYLSSILRRLILCFPIIPHTEKEFDDAFSGICELFKQYINLKIDSDIEEIYFCFRLLKRISLRSDFFLHVHDNVFPSLQVSIREVYGGNLQLSSMAY